MKNIRHVYTRCRGYAREIFLRRRINGYGKEKAKKVRQKQCGDGGRV